MRLSLSILAFALASLYPIASQSALPSCIDSTAVTFTAFDTTFDPDSRQLDVSVSGRTLSTQAGFNAERNAVFILQVLAFEGLAQQIRMFEACDVFPTCPYAPGPFSFKKVPFIDLDVRVLYRSENSTSLFMGCTKTTITQAKATYFTSFLYISSGIALLALLSGVVANYLSFRPGILYFLSGEGTIRRLPGFLHVADYAQYVVATGMFAHKGPQWYRRFTTNFRWSIFDWSVPFISEFADNHASSVQSDDSAAERLTWVGLRSYEDVVNALSGSLFLRITLTFALTLGAVTVLCCLFFGAWFGLQRLLARQGSKMQIKHHISLKIALFATLGMLHRLFLLVYFPLTLVALYGFTLGGISAGIMVSASLLVSVVVILPVYLLYNVYVAKPQITLFKEPSKLLPYGPMYNTLKVKHVKYAALPMLRRLAYAATLGLLQSSGLAQILVILTAELVYVGALALARPHENSFVNYLEFALGTIRLLGLALALFQAKEFGFDPTDISGLSFGMVLMHLLVLLGFLVLILFNVFKAVRNFRAKQRGDLFDDPDKPLMSRGQLAFSDLTMESFEYDEDVHGDEYYGAYSGWKGRRDSSVADTLVDSHPKQPPVVIAVTEPVGNTVDNPASKRASMASAVPPRMRPRFASEGNTSLQTKGLTPTGLESVHLTPLPGGIKKDNQHSDAFFVPSPLKEEPTQSSDEEQAGFFGMRRQSIKRP